jgi:hypothetical protein
MATVRTTVRLDDDVFRAVKHVAEARGKTFGEVLSDLARKGLEHPPRMRYDDDLPTFDVREGSPMITPDLIRDLLEDEG